MTSTEEAFRLLHHAGNYLDYAETNRRSSIYGPSVSLAYYAAFYAAQAVVAYHRRESKTHRGARNLFNELAVHKSDFPSEVSPLLSALGGSRVQADYDYETMDDWKDEDAVEAIRQARTFVDEVNAWFRRHHSPGDD